MTDKEKIEKLKGIFDDTIWMAIRYANGRKTYAPDTVRTAVKEFEKMFPDWELKPDKTIRLPPLKDMISDNNSDLNDYLYDLFIYEDKVPWNINPK